MAHKIRNNPGRIFYIILVIVVVALGFLSRRLTAYFPEVINLYLGDILWALMVYFLVRVLFVNWSMKKVAIMGLFFCFLIELSQLYQAAWINSIRKTTLGALILGFGFLWSDLLAYSLGILSGIIIDYFVCFKKQKGSSKVNFE